MVAPLRDSWASRWPGRRVVGGWTRVVRPSRDDRARTTDHRHRPAEPLCGGRTLLWWVSAFVPVVGGPPSRWSGLSTDPTSDTAPSRGGGPCAVVGPAQWWVLRSGRPCAVGGRIRGAGLFDGDRRLWPGGRGSVRCPGRLASTGQSLGSGVSKNGFDPGSTDLFGRRAPEAGDQHGRDRNVGEGEYHLAAGGRLHAGER